MAKNIAKINAVFTRSSINEQGELELTFTPCVESRYAAAPLPKELRRLAAAGKEKLVLSIAEHKGKRSLEQNRLMWALLEIMASHLNGGRTGGVTAWDCYIDTLEEFGAKFEYLECLKEAFPALQEMFRAVKIVEERKDGKTVMCKAYIGSSHFNKTEMNLLIEGIFDRLSEMGVDSSDEVYLRNEWYS